MPDAVIDKYLSGDELIASGSKPDILFSGYSDAGNGWDGNGKGASSGQ